MPNTYLGSTYTISYLPNYLLTYIIVTHYYSKINTPVIYTKPIIVIPHGKLMIC